MATGSIIFRSADGRTQVIDEPENGGRFPLGEAGLLENNTDRELRLIPPAGQGDPAVLQPGGSAQIEAGSAVHVV
ncbi:hypothetical protein [Streptomyces marincola]|uniref:hypothetical protein n=1 Tax=Streptomyces marincola TaxID=2878388 RepID=UPI001CF1DFF6|nr:hypothetical protein [Streptomyces marincola]UCM89229.1 hypothetical protein LC193_15455 [Streptomyces marincola]